MSDVSIENPTGLRSFDHREIATLTEYQAARAAVDALVHALNRQQRDVPFPVGQAEWIELVSDFARSNAYADNCERCESGGDYDARYPIVVEVSDDGMLDAFYRCGPCERTWSTRWSVDAPNWV